MPWRSQNTPNAEKAAQWKWVVIRGIHQKKFSEVKAGLTAGPYR